MDKNQKIVLVFVVGVILLIIAVVAFQNTIINRSTNEDDAKEVENHGPLETQNVGSINIRSIPNVQIQTYQDDNYAEARFIRNGERVLDLYQFDDGVIRSTGKDYTDTFTKTLIDYFDYPEGIELDGDATFSDTDAVYVIDDKSGSQIIGLFVANATSYLFLEIPKYPIEDDICASVKEDIMRYTGWNVRHNFNDFQNMKKVRVKNEN